jgi:uncharacterized protein (TIGR03435 family)
MKVASSPWLSTFGCLTLFMLSGFANAQDRNIVWKDARDLPSFDVVSVRPESLISPTAVRFQSGHLLARQVTLTRLISVAYGIPNLAQLTGLSGVFESSTFTIEAKTREDTSYAQMRLMLQRALIERFGLQARVERRRIPVFHLMTTGSLPSSVTSKPVDACPGQALQSPETSTPCTSLIFLGSGLLASNLTMAEFALQLGQLSASITGVDAPILDRTKLTERYSFRVNFSVPPGALVGLRTNSSPDLPHFTTALREQLGLRLERAEEETSVFVVTSVRQPTPN